MILLSWLGAASASADTDPGPLEGLKDWGLTPSLVYYANLATDVDGGVKHGTTYMGNLHLQLKVDGSVVVGIPGLSGFIDGLWINGGQPSKYVGDIQGVSSLAAPGAVRLYEAWLQYNTSDGSVSVLAGRYDVNTEFYQLNSAAAFMNASFGLGPEFGQSGFAGPSGYPDTSLGVRLAYRPDEHFILRGAVLDGTPLDRIHGSPDPFDPHSGLLLVGEVAYTTGGSTADAHASPRQSIGRFNSLSPYDTKVALGAWHYTASFSDLRNDGTQHHGLSGTYLLSDHLLYAANDRRVSAFLELGFANEAVDRFANYFGGGFLATGLVPGRPDDLAGIATAIVRNGSHYIAGQRLVGLPVRGTESSIELTYAAQVRSWLLIQPDLQYVVHPNTSPGTPNATALQLRGVMTF